MIKKAPVFSIIIPTFNRPSQLMACLAAISNQSYPAANFEVIVVDDGGHIPLKRVLVGFDSQIALRILSQPHRGPGAARNHGASHAKGNFLAFTDDDCAPASDWLEKLEARFHQSNDCAVGGQTVNGLVDNRYSTASQLLVDYLYTYYNVEPNRAHFLTSNNLAIPTELFHAVGGFDEKWLRAAAEDREFCDRWLFRGHRLIYAPEALVYHSHELTFHRFCRQHFNYGRGAYYFHLVRIWRNEKPSRIEPLSFYLRLLTYPFSRVKNRRTLPMMALLVLSQASNAAGFFWEKVVNGRRLSPLNPHKPGPVSQESTRAS